MCSNDSHRYYPPETIKCYYCGWDSGIGRVNHMVIYYDIICPNCNAVVIQGRYGKRRKPNEDLWPPYKKPQPQPWKPWPKPYPRKNDEYGRWWSMNLPQSSAFSIV